MGRAELAAEMSVYPCGCVVLNGESFTISRLWFARTLSQLSLPDFALRSLFQSCSIPQLFSWHYCTPYGPTFTTGDVIGCCVNLINNTCFYTKNGHSLGEIVDANFGQQPFVFDIEDYMREWRAKIQSTIKRFPIGDRLGEWQAMLQNMVSSYLVHHGYCSTATAFARVTDTAIQEEQTSIKNRQSKLLQAVTEETPVQNMLAVTPPFLLPSHEIRCRQFVEMVNGTDSEVRCFSARSPRSQDSYPGSPSLSPRHGSSNSHVHSTGADSPTCSNGVMSTKSKQSHSKYPTLSSSSSSSSSSSPSSVNYSESNSTDSTKSQQHSSTSNQETSDSEMEMEAEHYPNGVLENSSTRIMNGTYKHEEILQTDESSMEDSCPQRQLCGGNHAATERMIQFGRELQMLSEQLCREYGKNTVHKKMLQDAFSLLAYSDPWNCPVGQQLDPIQREPVCAALNSAILESQNLPKQPPLMLALGQASECLRLMARVGLGSCSFARVDDYLH
uniref:CRA domain-containing protein n=1 Tax=Pavo cristatus TaxID=9049 RepID=A0A8C9FTY0_PAVCR